MKTKLLSSLMVAGSVLSMAAPVAFADEAPAEKPAEAKSTVKADVKSGGLHLIVNGNGTGADAKDVNFGTLKINGDINPVKVADLATVTDHTGANGWELKVKTTNYADVEKTMKVTLNMDGKDSIMTSADSSIATGQSQLDDIVKEGTFKGEWGVKPEAKAFSQALTWTLSPAATPGA